MYTLKQAQQYAEHMTFIHHEPWLVFKTPDGAHVNKYPANIYNKGRYAACKASERQEYERGGAVFVEFV